MRDRIWQIYSGYFVGAAPISYMRYICEVAVDYLFEIHSIMLEMQLAHQPRLTPSPLVDLVSPTVLFVKDERV